MAILAFLLLAHEPAGVVAGSIEMLLAADETATVVLHYDGNAPKEDFRTLEERYGQHARVRLVAERARCGWGQFGLVEGTVRALRLLGKSGRPYTHAYLLSCSCWPLRPLGDLRRFFDHNEDVDFIESEDESWMTGGLREERYTRWHPFGFTRQRRLFEASVALQRRFGITRRIPADLTPRYGAQWWCLRRETIEAVLGWIDRNPSAYRFYRRVWIPDETFFQTVLSALGTATAGGYIPTLYRFNAHGKPVVFYDDHLPWLERQPYFFARKIARSAEHCRTALLARTCAPDPGEDAPLAVPEVDRQSLPGTRQRVFYGRIHEPASAMRNWPRALAVLGERGAVLCGPPHLTRLAGERLAGRPGLTVLGRLFHPERIDFGPGRDDFHGLGADETRLRDQDRALYLARVLARCPGFPVFALCPGDDPRLEASLPESETLISVPLSPDVPLETVLAALDRHVRGTDETPSSACRHLLPDGKKGVIADVSFSPSPHRGEGGRRPDEGEERHG